MKKIYLLMMVTLALSGCEKDDICTEETTPRLILEFYDISNPANLKNVLNVKVKGVGQMNDLATYNSVSKIALPLRPTENSTKYSLIINSTSSTVAPNEDFLEFDYTHKNVFVSRACGYKTTYTLNNPNGILLTDAATPDTFWIQDINIITSNITTENETHIKIYF